MKGSGRHTQSLMAEGQSRDQREGTLGPSSAAGPRTWWELRPRTRGPQQGVGSRGPGDPVRSRPLADKREGGRACLLQMCRPPPAAVPTRTCIQRPRPWEGIPALLLFRWVGGGSYRHHPPRKGLEGEGKLLRDSTLNAPCVLGCGGRWPGWLLVSSEGAALPPRNFRLRGHSASW